MSKTAAEQRLCAYALALARSRGIIPEHPGYDVEIDTETRVATFTAWGHEDAAGELTLPTSAFGAAA